jgi:hypothetical protein
LAQLGYIAGVHAPRVQLRRELAKQRRPIGAAWCPDAFDRDLNDALDDLDGSSA